MAGLDLVAVADLDLGAVVGDFGFGGGCGGCRPRPLFGCPLPLLGGTPPGPPGPPGPGPPGPQGPGPPGPPGPGPARPVCAGPPG